LAPASALLDPPGWDDGGDDFEYEGCHYAFAGWVFGRYAATPPRDALPARVRPGGLRWQHLLRRQYHPCKLKKQEMQSVDRNSA